MRDVVPLPAKQVDVTGLAPNGNGAACVSKSTVDLDLWDVRRNLRQRELGDQVVDMGDRVQGRRQPLPLLDGGYLIAAWTADVRDEHFLLDACCALPAGLRPVLGADDGALAARRYLVSRPSCR